MNEKPKDEETNLDGLVMFLAYLVLVIALILTALAPALVIAGWRWAV